MFSWMKHRKTKTSNLVKDLAHYVASVEEIDDDATSVIKERYRFPSLGRIVEVELQYKVVKYE